MEGIWWEFNEGFEKTLEEEILPCIRNFDELSRAQGFSFIRKHVPTLNPRRYLFYPTCQGDVFIKRYRWPKHITHISSILRILWKVLSNTDRATKEWKNLNQAFWKGGPTPEPIALGRKIGFERFSYVTFESYIICKRLNNFVHLPSYVANLAGNGSQEIFHFRKILAKKLAELLAGLHNRGIFPQDLNPKNFLIKEGKEIELRIVDLEKARFKSVNNSGKEAIFPLGQMAGSFFMLGEEIRQPVTRVDKLRFLKEYSRLRATDYKAGLAGEIEDYKNTWWELRDPIRQQGVKFFIQ